MNTDARELTESELYDQHILGEMMDRPMFSQNWWGGLMQTLIAIGTVAIIGLVLSLKVDVNGLMRDAPYVTKTEYDRDTLRLEGQLTQLERDEHERHR